MADPYASALELAALDELRQRCKVLQQAHDDLRARFDSLQRMVDRIGVELCDNGLLEAGFEKVAVYADANGFWSHMAKQEDNGEWSSKLGRLEDVRHPTEH